MFSSDKGQVCWPMVLSSFKMSHNLDGHNLSGQLESRRFIMIRRNPSVPVHWMDGNKCPVNFNAPRDW